MISGIFYQSIGGVRAMIAAIREELHVQAPVILTGGWAVAVAPHLDEDTPVHPHLVLMGIAGTLGALAG
jgi:pantothenate kinase type III